MALITANLLFALALFFFGLKLLSEHLQKISSQRFRNMVASVISSRFRALGFGIMSGALMQSATASLAILASMTIAGLITAEQALPIIAGFNLGITFLVFLATFDAKLAILFVAGISGIAMHFSRHNRRRTFWAVLFGLGLIFMSIDMLKKGVLPLAQEPWFSEIIMSSQNNWLISLIAGIFLGFIVQSSTVVAMLSVGFVDAGILQLFNALPLIYGSILGSSIFKRLLGSTFKGTARQLLRYQNYFDLGGVGLFIFLYFLEAQYQIPLVMAFLRAFTTSPDLQVALAFSLLSVVSMVVLTIFHQPIAAQLARALPPTTEQDLAQPKYTASLVFDVPTAAIDLIAREQLRELEQIGDFAGGIRADHRGPELIARYQSFNLLSEHLQKCCSELTCRELSEPLAIKLADIQNRQALICQLSAAANETYVAINQAIPHPALKESALSTLEALEFLLLTTKDVISNGDEQDIKEQLKLCHDRGPIMRELRLSFAQQQNSAHSSEQNLLLDLTIGFEKTVWILSRILHTA